MSSPRPLDARGGLMVATIGVLLAALVGAGPAFAEAPAVPHWRLESRAAPTNLPINGEGMIDVTAANLGDGDLSGISKPVTITDTLPAGLEATLVEAQTISGNIAGGISGLSCDTSSPIANPIECTFVGTLAPYEQLEILIRVKVKDPAPSEPLNQVVVAGGETAAGAEVSAASLGRPLRVNGDPTSFGAERYELTPENESGSADTQAGSHPFQLTTTFNLNEAFLPTDDSGGNLSGSDQVLPSAPALERNLSLDLPPGLIGNANVNTAEANPVGQCSDLSFGVVEAGGVDDCPSDTAVGVAVVTVYDPVILGFRTLLLPLFNLVPAPGEPARFGFDVYKTPVVLNTSVRTGEGYGVTVSVENAPQTLQVLGTRVTFWGVPGDPVHDSARGWECLGRGDGGWLRDTPKEKPCEPKDPATPEPFLTLPTSCGPLQTSVEGDAWDGEALVGPLGERSIAAESPTTLSGCEKLPFEPSVEVKPDEGRASTPTGLAVGVSMPQGPTLSAGENAEADVKSTTVELPEGMQASPGAADGLETCSVGQAGFDGLDSDTGSVLAGELEAQRFTRAEAACSDASKIGTVAIRTPLLAEELTGAVYMAAQDTNPFASPLVLYLMAEEPTSKVLVKLAGEVTLNPVTGQLVSTFRNTPPLPFEHLTLHLFNSARASQSTPPLCGTYTTRVSLTPWSGGPAATPSSTFQITEGADGGPCETSFPQSFAPSFAAGSTSTQAGGFTPFELTIEHPDADQPLSGIAMQLPEGIAALLAKVTPCPEPAAGQPWSCGPESLIGSSSASSGLGAEPYTLPGSVYLTVGYDGAPFGLLDATEAKAGPFNLGMVYVRSRINVNPETAAVSVTTDPGPHGDSFPTILKGVPVALKQLNVTIDRPEFQFNPTSCASMAVTGTLSGAQGSSEAVSSPFKATNCAALPFKPKLTATAGGHGSKANGTSFDVKIVSPGLGQANIHKVDLTLPKVLPSRLTTLQKACLEKVFDANPASCDAGSVIGSATVHTPVLKRPLIGPAYLVSHGGAAFPDVEFVLQGEGITLVLDGKTDIKNGITYSKFETAPDAPFTSFETVLPAGPHSILTTDVPERADYTLCGRSLAMPTEITAQDGAVIKGSTQIALAGCKAAKKLTRAQKLKRALKKCRQKKNKAKRAMCEKQARKKYGPRKKGKGKKKK